MSNSAHFKIDSLLSSRAEAAQDAQNLSRGGNASRAPGQVRSSTRLTARAGTPFRVAASQWGRRFRALAEDSLATLWESFLEARAAWRVATTHSAALIRGSSLRLVFSRSRMRVTLFIHAFAWRRNDMLAFAIVFAVALAGLVYLGT